MNFDGGRYFLTVLVPLRTEPVAGPDGARRAPEQIVRRVLATLPVAQQDRPSVASGLMSPFARVPRTHFARFFMLDQLRYNGRRRSNAIRDLLLRENLLQPEPIDRFAKPYLVFMADFDAPSPDETHLDSYLRGMWINMEEEIRLIFGHCPGFEEVDDAAGFSAFIRAHQVETTMPYTDYWTGTPPRWDLPIYLAIGSGVIVAASLALWFGGAWHFDGIWLFLLTLLILVVFAIGLVVREGLKIWPAAPHSDVASVLKALYLQQNFVRFAIDHQGADDAALHADFGRFLDRHRLDDLAGPTQSPGTLKTPGDAR
ncbi:hypothetical protein R5H30_00785 [Sulfitobacter sp. D35]|uniref:hypothetical protein n=1 Tax=Sulfitobacter sp. D35 TaxID=3083252 RepID=UPI00296F4DF1|nr:hypothetical protein [Sulfitobacter sp. D35]MDW4496500.1 hypothetical protein [Sulfitobacter sp. D35]